MKYYYIFGIVLPIAIVNVPNVFAYAYVVEGTNLTAKGNQTETNEDKLKQFREQLQKKAEEYFKSIFETSLYNATGIHVDLDKNYTQEEKALIASKLLNYICSNNPTQPEIKHQCDLTKKQ